MGKCVDCGAKTKGKQRRCGKCAGLLTQRELEQPKPAAQTARPPTRLALTKPAAWKKLGLWTIIGGVAAVLTLLLEFMTAWAAAPSVKTPVGLSSNPISAPVEIENQSIFGFGEVSAGWQTTFDAMSGSHQSWFSKLTIVTAWPAYHRRLYSHPWPVSNLRHFGESGVRRAPDPRPESDREYSIQAREPWLWLKTQD